jgi:hypothetical protein
MIGNVRIDRAFESPDQIEGCAKFLTEYAKDTKAFAICVVVDKADIGYPQVWKSTSWPFKPDSMGVFVQLDLTEKRRIWFIPSEAGILRPDLKKELDFSTFQLLPPILKRLAPK